MAMTQNELRNVTIYQNEMNLVPLRNFKSVEIDLFFTICTRLKEKGSRKVKIEFDDLRTLSNYHAKSGLSTFVTDLEHVYDKMQQLTYTERTENKIKKFTLFTYYEIDIENKEVEIALNPDLQHILNDFTNKFTRFELQELTGIKSSYSKHMFRLLKQFRKTGTFIIDINDFRDRLDIPDSYQMNDINKRVIKPVLKDLSEIFTGLKVKKVREGRAIKTLVFTFQKESDKQEVLNTTMHEQLSFENTKKMWNDIL